MDLVTRRSLGPFAAEWDALVARQPYPSPFLRTWWLDATATGEPIFVLVLEDSRLIGGLAVQRRRRLGLDIVEMMGQGPLEPDHLDLIAEPGREATAVAAIGGWLTRPGQRVLDFDGVEPFGLLMAALPSRSIIVRRHVSPALRLPTDLDAWLKKQHRKVRNQIGPTGRRLDKDGIVFRRVPRAEAAQAAAELRDLHVERHTDRTAIPPHWTALTRAIEAGSARGEAVQFQLRDGDEVGAAGVHFDLGGRRSYYQSGRLMDSKKWRGAGQHPAVAGPRGCGPERHLRARSPAGQRVVQGPVVQHGARDRPGPLRGRPGPHGAHGVAAPQAASRSGGGRRGRLTIDRAGLSRSGRRRCGSAGAGP